MSRNGQGNLSKVTMTIARRCSRRSWFDSAPAAAITQVESKANSLIGKWACAPQAAALAYLVKFNSDNATNLVHRAMTSTHDTQCYETLFSSVSVYAHGPALNEAAVNALQTAITAPPQMPPNTSATLHRSCEATSTGELSQVGTSVGQVDLAIPTPPPNPATPSARLARTLAKRSSPIRDGLPTRTCWRNRKSLRR